MAENGNAPVKHYSARLELPHNHITIDLMGDDLSIVKETVQAVMKGGCRFEPFGSSTLIYHPTVDGGKTALGWVATHKEAIFIAIAHSRLPHVEPNHPVTWAQGPAAPAPYELSGVQAPQVAAE